MAKATEEHVTAAGYNEADFEWETVHEEAPDQVVFEDEGDLYVGEYAGHEVIYPVVDDQTDFFIQLHWRDPVGMKVTNAGYELRETYVEVKLNDDGTIASVTDKIPVGTMTRNLLAKKVDVGQPSPMKSFRVDTAKSSRANSQSR